MAAADQGQTGAAEGWIVVEEVWVGAQEGWIGAGKGKAAETAARYAAEHVCNAMVQA